MKIQTSVTIHAHSKQVRVCVQFENMHEDHVLRAMFPTGIKTDRAEAGGHFTVDSRPIRAQGPDEGGVWPDMGGQPMNGFVDISDGKKGLAFINDCLTEYEVLEDEERTVALTLVRSVRNEICTERSWGKYPSQKGGQCLGKHCLNYALLPHRGNWNEANIPLETERFNTPIRIAQTGAGNGSLNGKEQSFLEISNTAVRFSCIKKMQDRDGFILRIYNPTQSSQETQVRIGAEIQDAWLTNMNEERMDPIERGQDNLLSLSVAPQKILNIELQLAFK
jgi:mannosylglycerate hydrolase